MPTSRYAKFNPFGGSQLTASPISEEPLQFSNIIPDSAFDSLPGSSPSDNGAEKSSKKQRARVSSRKISSKSTGHIPYGTLDGSRPPRRQRTGSSLYRVASSVRDFAVSHFNVPAVAAPWEHTLPEKYGSHLPASSTVRYFDYRRQRRRLLINSSFQWLITALICAALAGCLYGFSTIVQGLSNTRKQVFNALVTGLSLCLGLNLASSLSGYAQMMRWRFLASGYRTLQDFELVMNFDSQSKVFRLIWAGRTRGRRLPNKTQVLAVAWLAINIAVQIFTALLGLTYSIDVSSNFVSLAFGNVSIADVSYIGNSRTDALYGNNESDGSSLLAETAAANEWGISGQDFNVFKIPFDRYFGYEQAIYTDGSLYWYRFVDRSPLALSLAVISERTVNATATCQSFPITYGGYAGFQTDNASIAFDVTWVDVNGDEHTWWIPNVATGATTWMSNLASDCGPRCLQIYALQTADNITTSVPKPRFWSCFSNVSHVDNVDLYVNPNRYQIPDTQAQLLAGAIGWSGTLLEEQGNNSNSSSSGSSESSIQIVPYPASSQWSPPGNVTADEMARLVMKFTAGAIAALDSNGPRMNVTGFGPAPAQVLDVTWRYAGSILGAIPVAQGLVLLAVILLADKAIIKDTSHLAMARLLRPIVDKLGDTGCLLTGDEIAERLGNLRVIYGVRDPDDGVHGLLAGAAGVGADDGSIRHLDIIEETEGLGYRRGRMPEGRYDGVHLAEEEETEPLLLASTCSEAEAVSSAGEAMTVTVSGRCGDASGPRRQCARRRMSI
ncbi:uncharacterized protein Z520_09882 [Fonsecaea multimorphosa CBS 102226]|uniref:Uncharacterized protein n=1 Tax=Fonsecaea multimorphosa CBS 102226 TaxID=1442371 RepID=A0A0D2IBH7_9EURO|nr:uncharacterized protein Z520_09882 [Fonsecaea multimorphosa CBS 102226]KIX94496.1 hypothetical protein Z520_09882 [Fonsecaea multimorphosa CBS 102226]OAL20074.1 hypothetical protein AYO22_09224 [Fonsecaea multimorphosa]